MMFARHKQNILTLHERSSRILLATRPPNKEAKPTVQTLLALMAPLPQALRKTMTFDNGSEFAHHSELAAIKIQTFFCDPHSPWQKAESKTPSAECAASCPEKPISQPFPITTSMPS